MLFQCNNLFDLSLVLRFIYPCVLWEEGDPLSKLLSLYPPPPQKYQQINQFHQLSFKTKIHSLDFVNYPPNKQEINSSDSMKTIDLM